MLQNVFLCSVLVHQFSSCFYEPPSPWYTCAYNFVHYITRVLRYSETSRKLLMDVLLICICEVPCSNHVVNAEFPAWLFFFVSFPHYLHGPAGIEPWNTPQPVFFLQITSDLFNTETLSYHSIRRNPTSWYSVIEMYSLSIHPSVQRCPCKLPWEWQEV